MIIYEGYEALCKLRDADAAKADATTHVGAHQNYAFVLL